MQPEGLFGDFHAFSLNLGSHPIAALSDFPDSRTFYAIQKPHLPAGIKGLMYMATCNRVELYVESAGIPAQDASAIISENSPELKIFFERNPQTFSGAQAIEHLISVASGLQSLALGETQIAGQLKRDIAFADSAGWLNGTMHSILKKAQETQKKIRNTTDISRHSYSLMSLVHATISERGLSPLDSSASGVIIIGASEMSAKVARFALRRGINNFVLVRKDLGRSMNAEMQSLIDSNPAAFMQITQEDLTKGTLSFKADALVCASSASAPFIDAATIDCLVAHGKLTERSAVIDLALPANTAVDVAEKFKTRFISLASLMKISEAARSERTQSATEAEPIIRRAVYQLWLDSLYRQNSGLVQTYLEQKTGQTENEWQRSAAEAELSERQKRIMYDFIKKEQRRSLAQHREMILDLIAGVSP